MIGYLVAPSSDFLFFCDTGHVNLTFQSLNFLILKQWLYDLIHRAIEEIRGDHGYEIFTMWPRRVISLHTQMTIIIEKKTLGRGKMVEFWRDSFRPGF